jgi:hypothetical protein
MPEMRVFIRYALSALSNRWRCLYGERCRKSNSSCYPSIIWPVHTSKPSTTVDVKACYRERCQSVEPHLAPRVECAHRGATHVACAAIPRWRRHFQHPAACRPCERRRP